MISVHRQSSTDSRETLESSLEVLLEVFDIFEADRKAQSWAARRPARRGAILRTIERNDQAFEAAPGIAHSEELQSVEEGCDGLLRRRLQDDREESGRTREIPLPDGVARIVLHRRVKDARDFGALLEPIR